MAVQAASWDCYELGPELGTVEFLEWVSEGLECSREIAGQETGVGTNSDALLARHCRRRQGVMVDARGKCALIR